MSFPSPDAYPTSFPPAYLPALDPVTSLPPYPTSEDPSPPEYFEIIRFNASSYSWSSTNHQLQSAINARDLLLSTAIETPLLPSEAERAESERQDERLAVVEQHCRPMMHTGSSVRGFSSLLERWGELLEITDVEKPTSEAATKQITKADSDAKIPGWMQARMKERASTPRRRRGILSWFSKNHNSH